MRKLWLVVLPAIAVAATLSAQSSHTYVAGNGNTAAAVGQLAGTDAGGVTGYSGNALQISLVAGQNTYVNTGYNFGVGTTNPAWKFTVASDGVGLVQSKSTGEARFFTQITSGSGEAYLKDSSDAIRVKVSSAGDSYFAGGHLLIGLTSSPYNFGLDVSNSSNNGLHIANGAGSFNNGLELATMPDGRGRITSYDRSHNSYQDLYFETTGAKKALLVKSDGNVGIGVDAPGVALDVAGDIRATGTITGATVLGAVYQDVAEWVPSGGRLPAGTVVVIDPAKRNEVLPSSRAYDTSVAGVVSDKPGVLLGVGSSTKSKIATTGRVRVRVDATKHPIRAGDLLVTSDKPGVAMYSDPVDLGGVKIHRPGTLVGKALESLPDGEGDLLVLLSLQ